jgi:diacylglycerol kinase (ATP)
MLNSHFFKAFKYSMQGIRACYKTEVAFRQEVRLFLVLFPTAIFISRSINDFLILVMPMFLVLVVELLNTSLENTINKTIPQQSNRAGMAKDQGSAAVFTALTLTALCWALILIKYYLPF